MDIPQDSGEYISKLEEALERLLEKQRRGECSSTQTQELEGIRRKLQTAYAGSPFSR